MPWIPAASLVIPVCYRVSVTWVFPKSRVFPKKEAWQAGRLNLAVLPLLTRMKTFDILGLWSTCVNSFFFGCSESVSFPDRGQSGVKGRSALGFPLKKDDIVNSISHKFSQHVFIDIYYLEHEVKVINNYIYCRELTICTKDMDKNSFKFFLTLSIITHHS